MIQIIPEVITLLLVGVGLSSAAYIFNGLRRVDSESLQEQVSLFLPLLAGMVVFLIETAGNAVHTLNPFIFGDHAGQLEDVFLLGQAIFFTLFLLRLKKKLSQDFYEWEKKWENPRR